MSAPKAFVVIASNRAAAGVYEDETGPVIVEALQGWGFDVASIVVPDGKPVKEAMLKALSRGARVILTSGGTGLTPTDKTPEMTRPLIDVPVPGLADAIRMRGIANGVPTAALSRGLAGISGNCLIVNLPGSKGGVKDGLAALDGVLMHAVEQITGSDH
ncbi:MogA/MoaB family molybdenum cofactor biosynthesis protein [Nocardioides cavernaquae]|uniref:MogA/MoaB family molybdenum cofactor biosynthesis protein n=1 Tax=Nocardioides cavernaquae TaxID=2321396 RepID=A0A3A5HEB6_9ACTN|nr:MogA/MoaB family molybdenum cofactor biosynthesis protein [Nocardioides cavernaquae]RJS46384.1 MogA/MoaB family molybdenum cofactor biosynthesis protein [Nocardioides cavernaquae]